MEYSAGPWGAWDLFQCRAQSFSGQVKLAVGQLLHYERLASTGGKAAGFQLATSSWQAKIFPLLALFACWLEL